MQASKIKIGEVYAINYSGKENDYKGQLVRFAVSAVTTRRTGSHSSDFTHRIEGVIQAEQLPDWAAPLRLTDLKPDDILGPFADYAELVRSKQEANDRKNAEAKAVQDRAIRLVKLLYKLTGTPLKADITGYDAPFRVEYGNHVRLNDAATTALLAYFDKKQEKAA